MFRSLQSRQNGTCEREKLFSIAKGSKDFVQRFKLDHNIEAHTGCVNTLCWSSSGYNILSGSDDQHLVISDPFQRKKIVSIRSDHRANIFSAKYLPFTGDKQIVSCSGDGKIYHTTIGEDQTGLFDCHFGTTYEVIVVPTEASTFLSCGEDGTVRWFDLRLKSRCIKEDCKEDVLINCRRAVTALAINPILPYQLAIGCSDSSVRIFDRRMLGTRSSGQYTGRGLTGMVSSFTAPNLASRSHRITSLSYSPDGNDVLVSYSSEYVYLFGTNEMKTKQLEKVFTKPEKVVEPSCSRKTMEPWTCSHSNQTKTEASNVQKKEDKKPDSSVVTERADSCTSDEGGYPQGDPVTSDEGGNAHRDPVTSDEGGYTQGVPGTSDEGGYAHTDPGTSDEGGYAQLADPFVDGPPDVSRQPPFKRLRMRGDWSDTGPNARPEAERNAQGRQRPLMQRMSDMLTRWLDGNIRNADNTSSPSQREQSENQSASQESTGQEGSTEMEGVVSGWQNMPSTSGSNEMETDEQETSSDLPTVPSLSSNDNDENTSEQSTSHQSSAGQENSHDDTNRQSDLQGSSNHGDNSSVHGDTPSDSLHRDTSDISDNVGSVEDRELEPVISLHYSTEGTTSSTIRLGFARFENLEAGILQRSAENASLSPLVTADTSSQSISEQHLDIESQREVTPTNELSQVNAGQRGVTQTNELSQVNAGQRGVTPTNELSQENTGQRGVTPTNELSQEIDSQSDDRVSCDQCSDIQNTSGESSVTPHTEGQSSTPKCHRSTDNDQISPEMSDLQIESEAHQTDQQPSVSTASGVNSSTLPVRQRRIGRSGPSMGMSGPSMGDIQLGLEVENSDDEQHDEGTGAGRDTLERHITAIRLQEMYRKRQEEKEKEEMEIRNIFQPSVKVKYRGHRNARTMIKEANFWGDNFVMSGSDCGHIFIWDRLTSKLVMLLEGDRHVVNCLQPHPYDPILASSGIDYDIKIWAPLDECPNFHADVADEIISRNEVMLEETRDTITVPAAFMLRVLASLNQIRAGRASVSNGNQEQGGSDSD